ncbi:MAG: hypothetical protein ABR915_22510 [Thermoguttaceae bacterium]
MKRLRITLNGSDGESLPTEFNTTKASYATDSGKFPMATWTLWHMDGYGLLYVVTGEKKYADLARKCVEMALDGQRDRDDRYAWNPPASEIRAGPCMQAMALAYDLCYDAWDADFRQKIALELQNFKKRGNKPHSGHLDMSLEQLCLRPNMGPGSNHFGPQVGGAAIALLAIKGDPGTDAALIEKYLAGVQKSFIAALTQGWGDHGFFAEGQGGPGGMAGSSAFVTALQAMKVAGGKDFIAPRPNAAWITLHWPMELIKKGDACCFPLRTKADGSYGTDRFDRKGLSHGGQFAQGFGAVANDDQRAALLWVYQHFVEPGESTALEKGESYACKDIKLKPGEKTFDVTVHPHRAVFALVNWPLGLQPKNPAEVLGHCAFDSIHNYLMVRNRWQDENDILVTAHLGKGPGGPYKKNSGPVMIWGLGQRLNLGNIGGSQAKAPPVTTADGSTILTFTDGANVRSLGVDFSKASGADALVVLTGPADSKAKTVTLGDATLSIVMLGASPEIKVEGDKAVIGGQTITVKDGSLVFGKTAAPAKR